MTIQDLDQIERNKRILQSIRTEALSGSFDESLRQSWRDCEAIRHYLHSFKLDNADQTLTSRYTNDALPRFFHTLQYLPPLAGATVLELGANPYLFTILVKRFRDYQVSLANFFSKNIYDVAVTPGRQSMRNDLYGEHYEFDFVQFNMELGDYPYPDEHFDIVLFTEILEHLVIDPLGVFVKIKRILKPGGRLVVTTPNAVRLINVANMLAGSNMFDRYHSRNGVYGRHNREFTLEELVNVLRADEFDIDCATTLDRYNYEFIPMLKDNYETSGQLPYSRKELLDILQRSGSPLENRGDNLYVVARKR